MDQSSNIPFQPSHSPPKELASPRLWSITNIFSGIVLVVSLALLAWAQLFHSRLDQVAWPEYGLPIIVSRMMELKEALKEISPWERRLYRALLVDSPNDVSLAISWYEELAANSSDPYIPVQLAILEGESGRIEHVRQLISDWETRDEPYPLFARLIGIAYLNAPGASALVPDVDLKLVWQIGGRWFHNRLLARLVDRRGDRMPQTVSRDLRFRSARTLGLLRLFIAIQLTIIIGGSVALFFLLFQSRSDPAALHIGTASIPPCWSGVAGITVFIRCGAIFTLLTVGAGIFEGMTGVSTPFLWLAVYLISILMLLVLTQRYLLKPTGLEMQQAFGLSPRKAGRGQLLLWVAVLLTAASLGDWGIASISERLGLPTHWTESFDSDFVWGNPSRVGFTGVQAVALGPIFEELVFRGLLFATLRRKFQPGSASVLSAIAFSMVHGYSVSGFVSVAWTGILWAWAYEKTKSLLPAIIAHCVQNFIWSIALIIFLRS